MTTAGLRFQPAAGLLGAALFFSVGASLSAQEVDITNRSVSIPAVVNAGAFDASTPPDDRYHALVHDAGGAAVKSLFLTPVADSTVARLMRELGALDRGGVPMSAWNLRWAPLIPQPDARVRGTEVLVTVEWPGAARPYELRELVDDSGAAGVTMRFGGHEHHDHRWPSGCILCLFSCPGGVISNASYSIRDHERGRTRFGAGSRLPPDGTPVTVTVTLLPA